jgi:glycosyltransferase involved in cell wall biosynthesis
MKDRPLVSVLMTAYNREKYIASAIESVLASGYANFELIVTDDRSTDATLAIAKQYAGKDERVRVFLNEQNLGDYPNRNQAASHARGAYLKYVDADDYIYPWGLEILVGCMEKFPEAGFGLCSLLQDDVRPFPFQLSPREAYAYHYQGPGLFHKAPLSAIIRTTVFQNSGGFAATRMVGDFEMWHRLGQRYPVVLMPHGIVWYRKHGEQEMNSHRKYLSAYESVKLKYLLDEECPLDEASVGTILRKGKAALRREVLAGIARVDGPRIKDGLTRLQLYKHV